MRAEIAGATGGHSLDMLRGTLFPNRNHESTAILFIEVRRIR